MANNKQGFVADNFEHVRGGVCGLRLRRNPNDCELENWLSLMRRLEEYRPIPMDSD